MCPFLQMRIYTFMVFCLRFNYFLSQRYCKYYNLRNYFSKILYFIGKKHVFICIACDFDVICLEIVTQTYSPQHLSLTISMSHLSCSGIVMWLLSSSTASSALRRGLTSRWVSI